MIITIIPIETKPEFDLLRYNKNNNMLLNVFRTLLVYAFLNVIRQLMVRISRGISCSSACYADENILASFRTNGRDEEKTLARSDISRNAKTIA